jgi:hypothetical protein
VIVMRHEHFKDFVASLVQPAAVDMGPLEQIEAKARAIWPRAAETGPLYVLRRGGGFFYAWGDAEISRTEAARRALGRSS